VNGPEHYREAERIGAAARSEDRAHQEGFTGWARGDLTALAQVHATLALAAATAAAQATEYDGDEGHQRSRGWAGVA
jgi:hypothetical protein